MGESKSYLDRCINGDGKIEEEIGLDIKKINSFENISNFKTKIEQIKEQFRSIKNNYFIYNQYKTFFDRRENLTSEELDGGNVNVTDEKSNINQLVMPILE